MGTETFSVFGFACSLHAHASQAKLEHTGACMDTQPHIYTGLPHDVIHPEGVLHLAKCHARATLKSA